MKITIPGNPISVNQLYRCRRFLTKKGETIKWGYQVEALRQYKGKPLKGNIIVDIDFFFADRRRHDIDNCLKALLDAFSGVLWEDDNQIVELQVRKFYAKKSSVCISAIQVE